MLIERGRDDFFGVFLQTRLGLGDGIVRILLDSTAALSKEPEIFSKEEVIVDSDFNDDACFINFIWSFQDLNEARNNLFRYSLKKRYNTRVAWSDGVIVWVNIMYVYLKIRETRYQSSTAWFQPITSFYKIIHLR